MYIGFRWNESILPPPIVDWSPKLTAGSRSSNLKSPWDGEINTRPHGAHANDQSLCSLPATQRLHVPTLDMSGIPLCSSRGFTTTTQGTHWSGGWLRLGTDGNRFFDSYFTLLHCGFNGNKMKQIYFMISVYSLYIIYISIYLSVICQIRLKPAQSLIHRNERCQKSGGSCMSSLFTANGSLDLPYFTAQIRSVLFATTSSWTPRHSKLKSQRCFNVS